MRWLLFCLILNLFAIPTVSAKRFQTKFMKLELPPNWSCQKEELDWVCQPDNVAERSEVIMVLVTKKADPVDDKLEKYKAVLNETRRLNDLLGNSYLSEIRYTKESTILERKWIDSLHFGSEIPHYYTRYVASVNSKIAGLVTYSIAESAYQKWAKVMDEVVQSLDLRFDPKAFAEIEKELKEGSLLPSGVGGTGARVAPPPMEIPQDSEETDDSSMLLLAILIAGVGVFIYWRRKNKNSST